MVVIPPGLVVVLVLHMVVIPPRRVVLVLVLHMVVIPPRRVVLLVLHMVVIPPSSLRLTPTLRRWPHRRSRGNLGHARSVRALQVGLDGDVVRSRSRFPLKLPFAHRLGFRSHNLLLVFRNEWSPFRLRHRLRHNWLLAIRWFNQIALGICFRLSHRLRSR